VQRAVRPRRATSPPIRRRAELRGAFGAQDFLVPCACPCVPSLAFGNSTTRAHASVRRGMRTRAVGDRPEPGPRSLCQM
jgi:hypothetical protein